MVMRRSPIVRTGLPQAAVRSRGGMLGPCRSCRGGAGPRGPGAPRPGTGGGRRRRPDSYVCRPWPPGGIREALVGHKVTGSTAGKQVLVETDGPVLGLHLGMSGSLRFDEDPGCASSGSRSSSPTAAPWSCATRGGSAVTLDPARGGWPGRHGGLAGPVPGPGRAQPGPGQGAPAQPAGAGRGGQPLADEALWRAGIDLRRRGVDLDPDELARLRRAVRAAIRGALAAGGTGRSARQVTRPRPLPPPRLRAVHHQGRRPHDLMVPLDQR